MRSTERKEEVRVALLGRNLKPPESLVRITERPSGSHAAGADRGEDFVRSQALSRQQWHKSIRYTLLDAPSARKTAPPVFIIDSGHHLLIDNAALLGRAKPFLEIVRNANARHGRLVASLERSAIFGPALRR